MNWQSAQTAWLLLGANTGLMIGLSASPIVGTFVTGAFTLVGLMLKSKTHEASVSAKNSGKLAVEDKLPIHGFTRLDAGGDQVSAQEGQSTTAGQPTHIAFSLTPAVVPTECEASSPAASEIAYWLLPLAIGIPLGLFIGMGIRYGSEPSANLRTNYSNLGFDAAQIDAMMNQHVRALTGRYRNLRDECNDLGFTTDQANLIVAKIAEAGALRPTRHSVGGDSGGVISSQASGRKSGEPVPDSRTSSGWRIFGSAGVTWLDKYLERVEKMVPSSQPAATEPEEVRNKYAQNEASLVNEANRYLEVIREAALYLKSLKLEDGRFESLYNSYEEYLSGMLNPQNGKTLKDRKLRLVKVRERITEILKSDH